MQDGLFLGCVSSAVCCQCVSVHVFVWWICAWVPACVSACGAHDCAVISQEEETVQIQTVYLPLVYGSTRFPHRYARRHTHKMHPELNNVHGLVTAVINSRKKHMKIESKWSGQARQQYSTVYYGINRHNDLDRWVIFANCEAVDTKIRDWKTVSGCTTRRNVQGKC